MIVDRKDILQFSDKFHKNACEKGVRITRDYDVSRIDALDISDIEDSPFASFRSFRDAHTYCVLRGWTVKEVVDDTYNFSDSDGET